MTDEFDTGCDTDHGLLDDSLLTTAIVLMDEDRKQPARRQQPPTINHGCLAWCFVVSAIIVFSWYLLA